MSTVRPSHPTTALPRLPGTSAPLALRRWYVLSVVALTAVAALHGLVVDDAYRAVPPLLEATWRAQDAATLLTLPVLVAAAARARQGSFGAHVVAVGIHTWLAYCYAHLAIGTPFNVVFLVYVAVLVMAGFATLDGLLRVDVRRVGPAFTGAPHRFATWFLVVAGLGVAALWLSDIVPGTFAGLPREVHLAELPNPTWVLDLAWIIPWSLAAGWMTSRRHPAAPLAAGVLLVMLLVLSLGMLLTAPSALAAGLGSDPGVRPQLVAFTMVFGVFGGCEAWLLGTARRRMQRVQGWTTPSWWRTARPCGCTETDLRPVLQHDAARDGQVF